MKFIANTVAVARAMPKSVWISALVIPGGLTILGIWLSARGIYRAYKRSKNDKG